LLKTSLAPPAPPACDRLTLGGDSVCPAAASDKLGLQKRSSATRPAPARTLNWGNIGPTPYTPWKWVGRRSPNRSPGLGGSVPWSATAQLSRAGSNFPCFARDYHQTTPYLAVLPPPPRWWAYAAPPPRPRNIDCRPENPPSRSGPVGSSARPSEAPGRACWAEGRPRSRAPRCHLPV